MDSKRKSHKSEFLRRHPEAKIKASQILTHSQVPVTVAINAEFEGNWTYLDDNGYSDIVKEPDRILNTEEAAFFLNPHGHKVLAPRASKNVYQNINKNKKECLTALITCGAAGKFPLPPVLFSYAKISSVIVSGVPSNWAIGKTETGWMNRILFFLNI